MAYEDFLRALRVVDPAHFDVDRLVADATREHEADLALRDAKITELEEQSTQSIQAKDAEIRALKAAQYDLLMKTPVDPAGNRGNPADQGSPPPTGGAGDDEVVEASFDSLLRKD